MSYRADQKPTLHFTQLAILRTLAVQHKPLTVAEVAEATNAANPTAQTGANNIAGQLRLLSHGRYVASFKRPHDPMVYTISQQGRALLEDNPQATRRFVAQRRRAHAAPVTTQRGTPAPYRPNFLTGAYTCPELRTPPPRGEASLAAYRLPSRGMRV